MNEELYREWYEVNSEEEISEKWHELAKKYDYRDIYVFRYNGNDGKYHREVFVFKELLYSSPECPQ